MNIKIGKAKSELLLRMNGADESISFIDSSRNNFTITANGNAQISTIQSKFGGSSAKFGISNDYLTTPNSSEFGFGTGDFTIEMWAYKESDGNFFHGIICVNAYDDNGILFRYQPEYDALYVGGVYYDWDAVTNFPINQWNHLALVRYNGIVTIYVNGTSVFSVANSNDLGSSGIVTIGASSHNYSEGFNGYIDNLRIVKGIATYTSDFVPSTSEFGSDGSLTITKGGSSKLNQKKYIDLLPPNFLSKIILSGGSYNNGTYVRNNPNTNTFTGPNNQYILKLNENEFASYDPNNFGGTSVYYSSDGGITWINEGSLEDEVVGTPPNSIRENSLTFLFDPIFYNSQITEGRIDGSQLDPAYLSQIRNYQIDNTIPNLGFNPLTWQVIPDTVQGTTKAEIKNNMYSYIKYTDNSDVEFKNYKKSYSSISSMQSTYGENPPKDNLKSFLFLRKNNNSSIYSLFNSSTLSYFIRLQRPVSHKNPNSGHIVREKKGIYLTSYASQREHISFGYRSPYYNITGRSSNKGIFNNFSFVFSFGTVYSAFSGPFNRTYNFTLMTDYKFNFGEVYFISIVNNSGSISIYINGELQTIARLPFNPIIKRVSRGVHIGKSYDVDRINGSPLGPGFYKKDGTLYPSEHINTSFSGCPVYDLNYLLFGKSKMRGIETNSYSRPLKRKRYLNNLDLGVIMSYNTALSQNQISEIYNNFRYRYI